MSTVSNLMTEYEAVGEGLLEALVAEAASRIASQAFWIAAHAETFTEAVNACREDGERALTIVEKQYANLFADNPGLDGLMRRSTGWDVLERKDSAFRAAHALVNEAMPAAEKIWDGRLTMPDYMEAKAWADYTALKGKVVLASEIECYDLEDRTSVTVGCEPPAILRIVDYPGMQARGNVIRWTDEQHIDPTYDIELLEPHPALEGVDPSWVYGTSLKTDGTSEPARFVVAPEEIQATYAVRETADETPGISPR